MSATKRFAGRMTAKPFLERHRDEIIIKCIDKVKKNRNKIIASYRKLDQVDCHALASHLFK